MMYMNKNVAGRLFKWKACKSGNGVSVCLYILAGAYKSMKFYLGCNFYNTVTLLWIKDEKKRQLTARSYEIIG